MRSSACSASPAEAGIKVMLDGQGSDEIFGGYYTLLGGADLRAARRSASSDRTARARERSRECAGLSRAHACHGSGAAAAGIDQGAVARSFASRSFRTGSRLAGSGKARAAAPARPRAGRDALRQELKLCVEHLTLPALLRYEDGNSMHFSIESRVPFCTPDLAQFALSLPPHYLVADDGDTKSVFRAAVADLVPEAILRREKVGFAVPSARGCGACANGSKGRRTRRCRSSSPMRSAARSPRHWRSTGDGHRTCGGS